ncbi:hypothetical protein RCL1_002826 [Eukaryota sp. TZLM3-RCL]
MDSPPLKKVRSCETESFSPCSSVSDLDAEKTTEDDSFLTIGSASLLMKFLNGYEDQNLESLSSRYKKTLIDAAYHCQCSSKVISFISDSTSIRRDHEKNDVYHFLKNGVLLGSVLFVSEDITSTPMASSPTSVSDPLRVFDFQASSASIALPKYVDSFLNHRNLLATYHDPIIPIINSTGLGKTRTVLNFLDSFNGLSSYCSLPRFKNPSKWTDRLATWPTDADRGLLELLHPLRKPKNLNLTKLDLIKLIVLIFESLIVQSLLGKSNLDVDLDKLIQPSVQCTTQHLCKSLAGNSRVVFVLDEVGTLIQSPFNDILNFMACDHLDHNWNLFRCFRYACRNLYECLNVQNQKFVVLVVGTSTQLEDFVSDNTSVSGYRPSPRLEYSYSLDVLSATIPPFVNIYTILDPTKFPGADWDAPVSDDLTLAEATSVRPLWVAYAIRATPPLSLLSFIQNKVANSFSNFASPSFGALFCIMSNSLVLSKTLMSDLVQYSFQILSSSAQANGSFFLFNMNLIDPILSAVCWDIILENQGTIPFTALLSQILLCLMSVMPTPQGLSYLLESFAATWLLYSIKQTITCSSALGRLDPCNLEDVLSGLQQCTNASKNSNAWRINACQISQVPEQYKQNYCSLSTLELAWKYRVLLMCPTGERGVDFIVPLKSCTGFGLLLVQVKAAVQLSEKQVEKAITKMSTFRSKIPNVYCVGLIISLRCQLSLDSRFENSLEVYYADTSNDILSQLHRKCFIQLNKPFVPDVVFPTPLEDN